MTIEISDSARRETPAAIAELLDQPLTLLVARIFVVLPFFVSGLVKCVDWQAGLEEMTRAGLHPAWAFNLAVLVTEICGSLSILLKRRIWLDSSPTTHLNGGNSNLWGELLRFLNVTSKNFLFFSELVGRVATKFDAQVSDLAHLIEIRNRKYPHEGPLKSVAVTGCLWTSAESSRRRA